VISVNRVGIDVYEVVLEGSAETHHRVVMSADFYATLCAGTSTHEWVLIQAFKFLLEHETRSDISPDFDLQTLPQRYPGFVNEMQDRLGFTQLKKERGWQ